MTESNPSMSTEELLSHAGWLRVLARQLTQGESAAEDALQETWLAALQSPRPAPRAARAWLATVLRNVLRQRTRADNARAGRERRAARTERVPSAGDVVARAHGQRYLVEAVLELAEPERSTILRHYFDGLTCAAIAREERAPESTVRNRLRRGLAELRQRLERGDRRFLSAVVALGHEPSQVANTLSLSLPWLMTASGKVTALVLIVGLCGFGLSWQGEGERPEPASDPVAIAMAEELADTASESLEEATVASARRSLADEEKAATPAAPIESEPVEASLEHGELEVLVLVGEEPAKTGWVHLAVGPTYWLPRDAWNAQAALLRQPIGADGIAMFRGLESYHLTIGVELEVGFVHQRRLSLKDRGGVRLVVELGRSRVRGHVYDEQGQSVVGARVHLWKSGGQLNAITWTDAEGAYDLRQLASGSYSASVDHDGTQNAQGGDQSARFHLAVDESRELDFGRPFPLPHWNGRVLTSAGEPVPNFVTLGRLGALHLTNLATESYFQRSFQEDGRFSLALEPGQYRVRLSLSSSSERHAVHESFSIDESGVQQDVIAPGCRVTGVLFDGAMPYTYRHGQPTISLREVPTGPAYLGKVGKDGRYIVDGVMPGTYELGSHPRAVPEGTEVVVSEQETTIVQDLELVP